MPVANSRICHDWIVYLRLFLSPVLASWLNLEITQFAAVLLVQIPGLGNVRQVLLLSSSVCSSFYLVQLDPLTSLFNPWGSCRMFIFAHSPACLSLSLSVSLSLARPLLGFELPNANCSSWPSHLTCSSFDIPCQLFTLAPSSSLFNCWPSLIANCSLWPACSTSLPAVHFGPSSSLFNFDLFNLFVLIHPAYSTFDLPCQLFILTLWPACSTDPSIPTVCLGPFCQLV